MYGNTRVKCFSVLVSEGYNLLAIYSKHKQLTGKSRLVPIDDIELRIGPTLANGVINPPHRDIPRRCTSNVTHCETCTCFLNQGNELVPESIQEHENPTNSSSNDESTENTERNEPKTLNFKEEVIVFNQEQLEEKGSPLYDR